MKKKCRCPIGRYWHSSSELCFFSKRSDIDGIGDIEGFFNYCPYCGKDLSDEIVKFNGKGGAK